MPNSVFTNQFYQYPTNLPPSVLLPWLTHKASLTEKLKDLTGNASVRILCQKKQKTSWWDKYCLMITEPSVIHRDVLISSNDLTYWFARSIIPESTFLSNEPFFDRLQTESLGKLIFNSNEVERLKLYHYSISSIHLEFHWIKPANLTENASLLWVRFSNLIINKVHPFYLVEIILPALLGVNN